MSLENSTPRTHPISAGEQNGENRLRLIVRAVFAFFLLPIFLFLTQGVLRSEINVSSEFEGGSGVVSSIDQQSQTIVLNPADHPGKGWRCWWSVRIDGLKSDSTFTVDVGEAPWATPDQAHISFDGNSWKQTPPGKREGKRIRYIIPTEKEGPVFLAWGPPFVPSDAEKLLEKVVGQKPDIASSFELCKTREGRTTPALRISAPGDASMRDVIWVQARQHAWESGSSWVAKGLIDFLVSDEAGAVALRERSEIFVIPIMDIDNVFRGAGGKSQEPQDHNRDWTSEPHWNAVKAAQQRIRDADDARRLVLFIDLHNPGANDRFPFFFTSPNDELAAIGKRNLADFIAAAKTEITGPLKFTGKTIESGEKYDPKAWQAISKNWVSQHCGDHVVAVTLETSWNTPSSTATNYELVGKQLGVSMALYLKGNPRRE